MSMTQRSFSEIINRGHLDQLEHEIMGLTFDLEQQHACTNMEFVYALVGAADELACREKRTFVKESFDHYIIERCTRALAHIRATYC